MASENPPLTDEIPLKTYIFDYKGCSIATFDYWRLISALIIKNNDGKIQILMVNMFQHV